MNQKYLHRFLGKFSFSNWFPFAYCFKHKPLIFLSANNYCSFYSFSRFFFRCFYHQRPHHYYYLILRLSVCPNVHGSIFFHYFSFLLNLFVFLLVYFLPYADSKETVIQLTIIISVPIMKVILRNMTSEKLVTIDVLEICTDAVSRVEE